MGPYRDARLRLPREDIDLPEDRGCLRWVLGIPLVVLYVPAVYSCFLALAMRPASPYDQLRDDARFMGGFSVFLCLLGLLITITPLYRRTMGRWWFAAPVLIATTAYFRATTV
ncbi:hypothetical protein [Streptomyces sp. A0592]|uniref:hypothetical protein n=1 Tax=Streptomyces sp. A0592 TaxID=2563099 RepID=UPI00109EB6BF|nr:hypothetical protein [Streptomyces sp. A0592]THA80187.1 hypothetical protein E6U81_29800 [Streptomyces sp. A0592]